MSYGSVQDGESVKVIFPSSGTVIAPRPMMILKSSQQQKEAKAFIDYALSPEGQKLVADAWLMPARTDIDARRPLFKSLKLLPEASQASASRKDVLERFAKLFGQQ